jgi:formylmethanofuran dehydrogenase subunit E
MNETCDECGEKFPVGLIIFTGRQYLCERCYELKLPTHMGGT